MFCSYQIGSFTYDPAESPSPPLADWYQTKTRQFRLDERVNALAVGDAVVIAMEPSDGVLTTPLIRLSDLHVDPGISFPSWSRVVVNVTHPDGLTTVRVEVLNPLDVLIVAPVLDSGVGTRDITVDLTGRSDPEIKVKVTLTAGSTPQINSILAKGDTAAASPDQTLFPDLPPDNARFGVGTPTLRFKAVDRDGRDLHYMVRWDTDSLFTTPFVKSSELDVGFFNDDDPTDTGPFAQGQTVEFMIPAALTNSETYYWRVRTKPGGGRWGGWSAPWSFRYDPAESPPPPLVDWYQTKTAQFETDALVNALAVGDAVVIAVEPFDGTLTTPLIRLSDLQVDPGTSFTSWSRVVVNATHPDPNTMVRVEVLNPLDAVIAGPVLDSGLGTRDITVDLTGRTEPVIYIRITLTAGSTPQINSILVQGEKPLSNVTNLFGGSSEVIEDDQVRAQIGTQPLLVGSVGPASVQMGVPPRPAGN